MAAYGRSMWAREERRVHEWAAVAENVQCEASIVVEEAQRRAVAAQKRSVEAQRCQEDVSGRMAELQRSLAVAESEAKVTRWRHFEVERLRLAHSALTCWWRAVDSLTAAKRSGAASARIKALQVIC